MAKQMPWTTPDGVDHPESYWLPMHLEISHLDKAARVVFYGFHNKAAYEAGRQPLTGANKAYSVSGMEYLQLVGSPPTPGINSVLGVVAAPCYGLTARLDTDDPTFIKTPDNQAAPKVSFFATAIDVA